MDTEREPNVRTTTFIQWKGTDLCMDLHCQCGEHNHYDGLFAHFVQCRACRRVYELATEVAITEIAEDDAHIPPMQPRPHTIELHGDPTIMFAGWKTETPAPQ